MVRKDDVKLNIGKVARACHCLQRTKQADFSVDKGESVQGCCFVSGSEKLPIKAESVWDLNSFNNRCITRLLTGFFFWGGGHY